MEKPVEPNKEDCCNSGCNPCIFDIYEKQLKKYEKCLQNGETSILSEDNGILQLEYTNFIVTKNENLCESHNLLAFKRQSINSKKIWWKPGDHFLYKFTASKETCTRAYTPIALKNETKDNYDFAIIVKKYDNGVVSTHLCSLSDGNVTLWRGPYGQYEIKPNKFHRIVMIAQGTGIAPFITIIDHILNNEDDMTKMILFYCCKNLDTILFRDELYRYNSYWNFNYEIFLSEMSNEVKVRYQEPIKNNKLNSMYIFNIKPFLDNDQFLLCGSLQFNKTYETFIRGEMPYPNENIILF